MRQRIDPHRIDLGAQFSEGARLLWGILEERGWSQAQLRDALGAYLGEVTRVLYGDRKPRLSIAAKAVELGVPVAAWSQKPSAKFVPPAARRPRKRAA